MVRPINLSWLAVSWVVIALLPLAIRVTAVPSPPPSERVVFAWERDGNIDLYLAGLDETGLRRLTRDPAADELPRCSADGRRLLFRRGGSSAGEVFRLDLESLEETRLTTDTVRDSNPQWAPDGRVYATKRVGAFDRIVTFDQSGNGLRVLPGGDWHDVMPALSADGNRLVHHTYRYGNDAELQLVDLTDGSSRRLTTAAGHDYEASFAGRDGVVFSSNRGGGYYRIYFMPITGDSDARVIADTGVDAWGPRASAHSGDVLFHTGKPGAWRLMLATVGGGTLRTLFEDGTSKGTADWCPAIAGR